MAEQCLDLAMYSLKIPSWVNNGPMLGPRKTADPIVHDSEKEGGEGGGVRREGFSLLGETVNSIS